VIIAQKYSAEEFACDIESSFPFLFALLGAEFMKRIFGCEEIIAAGQKTGFIRFFGGNHQFPTELFPKTCWRALESSSFALPDVLNGTADMFFNFSSVFVFRHFVNIDDGVKIFGDDLDDLSLHAGLLLRRL